jgi:hypothetical protein
MLLHPVTQLCACCRLFLVYHAMCNVPALRHRTHGNLLSRMCWYPLFVYMEHDVPCKVPLRYSRECGAKRGERARVQIRLAAAVAAYAQTIDVQIEYVLVDAACARASIFIIPTWGTRWIFMCQKLSTFKYTQVSDAASLLNTHTTSTHPGTLLCLRVYLFSICPPVEVHRNLHTCFHVTWTAVFFSSKLFLN